MRKTSLSLIFSLAMANAAPAYANVIKQSGAATEQSTAPTERKTPRIITIPRTASTPQLSEEERYAVREAISKEAKNFRGGDPIIITATAAIIILVGVILIVLLT